MGTPLTRQLTVIALFLLCALAYLMVVANGFEIAFIAGQSSWSK